MAQPSLVKTGPEYWNRLFRNNRDGTFSDVTENAGQGYGMGVAVGDYNNDGQEDLFVVGVCMAIGYIATTATAPSPT